MAPIFSVDSARCVRVTAGRAERTYTRGFLGSKAYEIDAAYDSFASSMSVYFYGQAPQLRPHRVWSEGRWVA